MDAPYVFAALWLAWGAWWLILARNVKAATRREPLLSLLLHMGPLMLAAFLLGLPLLNVPLLDARFLPAVAWTLPAGALLTAAGLLFTAWARHHIGRNWSGIVTIKAGHELVTTGPYALVRHPIYSGLLLALLGTAVAQGEWRGLLAVVIVLLALIRKLRIEERWMQEQFGDDYRSYCQRVPALLPFIY